MSKENSKELSKGVFIILILAVCILIFSIIFYSRLKNSEPAINNSPVQEIVDSRAKKFIDKNPSILKNLEIIEIKNCDTEFKSYACITLKNKSDRSLNNVMVVIDEYDKDGNILDDSGDTLKSFAAGAEYTFKMPITRENVVRWELSNIDEY